MRILKTLARPQVILFSFIAMMLIGASFLYFQKIIGGEFLDMSLSGQEAVKRMGEMDPAQRRAHFWITLTVDTLYPIAYGCFFAGATYKFSGSKKSWVALPAVVTMLADFCENISQIIALSGVENVLTAKTIFSPIKFTSYIVMTVLFLGIALLALIRYVKRGRA